MSKRVDLYSTYANFSERVLNAIRKETFGADIGQNSWLTVDEYDRFISWLNLTPQDHVLEVASGSGGPALYLAQRVNCNITGIDTSESGVATATQSASEANLTERVVFELVDANVALPFADNTFDGIFCIDAMNHFPDRLNVLQEWCRVLRPGRRAVFTDPVVITGPVTNDELAVRSAVGLFLFVPQGMNERFIRDAGLHLIQQQDVTENAALISRRWLESRGRNVDELIQIEGKERFDDLQKFFAATHRLTSERRLSRYVYLIEKPKSYQ